MGVVLFVHRPNAGSMLGQYDHTLTQYLNGQGLFFSCTGSTLAQCWASVCDAGPTFSQRCLLYIAHGGDVCGEALCLLTGNARNISHLLNPARSALITAEMLFLGVATGVGVHQTARLITPMKSSQQARSRPKKIDPFHGRIYSIMT